MKPSQEFTSLQDGLTFTLGNLSRATLRWHMIIVIIISVVVVSVMCGSSVLTLNYTSRLSVCLVKKSINLHDRGALQLGVPMGRC